jgi:uncharacterized protein
MQRLYYLKQIHEIMTFMPVVALLGPRQAGKTTLAKLVQAAFVSHHDLAVHYFDLEDPIDLARLAHPRTTLHDLRGLIIIDEVQRKPELFPLLRVLIDNQRENRWLILGSASRQLIQQSSESLAGRIAYMEIMPFSLQETKELNNLWVRGGFPSAYLADNEQQSGQWRKFYIKTFLEQDIPNLGIRIPPAQLRRFWMMLAHYHGNIFNASELANALNLSAKTIRHYLDILVGTFMVRELQPWFQNITKRQVKKSKIYFRDSGILHILLGIDDRSHLLTHPKLGQSWEGFALETVIRAHQADPENCYFWATHAHAELDLLIIQDGKRLGFEFKYSDAPRITKSMRIVEEMLHLDSFSVIYPGDKNYRLSDTIEVVALQNLID